MEDEQIIDLYLTRDEAAIPETAHKYGNYCHSIAYRILHNEQDSEECVNDTYMQVWCSIPPKHPSILKAFLGTITRNLSLNKYISSSAKKRGFGQMPVVLDELQACIPFQNSMDTIVDDIILQDALNRFLASLPVEKRRIFMQRYWYFSTIKEISQENQISESKVKMSLMRSRNALKKHLKKEGVIA